MKILGLVSFFILNLAAGPIYTTINSVIEKELSKPNQMYTLKFSKDDLKSIELRAQSHPLQPLYVYSDGAKELWTTKTSIDPCISNIIYVLDSKTYTISDVQLSMLSCKELELLSSSTFWQKFKGANIFNNEEIEKRAAGISDMKLRNHVEASLRQLSWIVRYGKDRINSATKK